MIKKLWPITRTAAFLLPLSMIAGCGAEQGALPGSTITVNPAKKEWKIGAAPCDNSIMQDDYFNISVLSPNGTPETGMDIRVSLNLAQGTLVFPPPPLAIMYLYDDLDGDGLYTNLITSFPHYTNTGNAGTKMLRVQYDLTCVYGGDLDVYSGTIHGSAHISVDLET